LNRASGTGIGAIEAAFGSGLRPSAALMNFNRFA